MTEPAVDLESLVERIGRPDDDGRQEARDRLDRLVRPPGGLGRIGDLAVWLAGAQGAGALRPLRDVRAIVLAADHGIASRRVSAWPADATPGLVARIEAGEAPVSAAARVAGVPVQVVDVALDLDDDDRPSAAHRVRRSSGPIDAADAMSRDDAAAAVQTGICLADELVDGGADLIVLADVGVGSTTPAATLIGLLTGSDAASVVGRASGIDDQTWMRKCAAIRDAMRRGRPVLGDQVALLSAVGGVDIAVGTGLLLGAAARRTPVALDGVVSSAAALVGQRVAFRAADWWLATHRTGDPAHELALDRLALNPLLDLGVTTGEGFGALAAVPLLRTASALLTEPTPLP